MITEPTSAPAAAHLWCLRCDTWVIAWHDVGDWGSCWLCGGCGKAYGLRPVPPAPAPWLPPTATLGMRLAAYRPAPEAEA